MEEREFSFRMSEEQGSMKTTIARLMKSVVANKAHEMDEKRAIPADFINKVWELGTAVSGIPEEYGGYGMEYSPIMNTIVLEELAVGDMALAIAGSLPSMFMNTLLEMGTDEQKKKYIPQYCDAATYKAVTVALNEPRFRFDAVALETKAEKRGKGWVLNGKKCFVPVAKSAGHLLVGAVAEGKQQLFIVASDNPGLKVGEREKNLGLYALETYPVALENCAVAPEDMVGGETGCNYERFLQKTRVAMAALGAGVARASFEYARDYAKERVQFGEPIASRQAIAFMIAEMAYEVEAMRLLAWKAASALEAGKDAKREAYLAKLYAGEMAMKLTDYGVQILGGHGYIRENPVERYYRNGRGIAILEAMAMV
jgi:alkylation response protein AidB-like acyl-CoA dehydrogenase